MQIGTKTIGPGHPVYIIAETGVTHNGDPKRAATLIDEAARAGADAVKFQMLDPDALFSEEGKRDLTYTYRTPRGHVLTRNLYELLRACVLPDEVWLDLMARARGQGIEFFATVESERSVERMEVLGAPAYKICSWDLASVPLRTAVGLTRKPILLDVDPRLGDIRRALRFSAGVFQEVVWLYAPHGHPLVEDYLLMAYEDVTGYSAPQPDGTLARAMLDAGASILESRLTLDRSEEGHHHSESRTPFEFREWASMVREHDAVYGGGRHPYRRDPKTNRRPYR